MSLKAFVVSLILSTVPVNMVQAAQRLMNNSNKSYESNEILYSIENANTTNSNTSVTNTFKTDYTDLYTVEDIVVDQTDANASAAKQKAIDVAENIAFQEVIKRLGYNVQIAMATVNKSRISSSVSSISVNGEKFSKARYLGRVTVTFDKEFVLFLLGEYKDEDSPNRSIAATVPASSIKELVEINTMLNKAITNYRISAITTSEFNIVINNSNIEYVKDLLHKNNLKMIEKEGKFFIYKDDFFSM